MFIFTTMFRIHDFLYGSGSVDLIFSSVAFKMPTKNKFFLLSCFTYSFLKVYKSFKKVIEKSHYSRNFYFIFFA
jgi:hypothetical protein